MEDPAISQEWKKGSAAAGGEFVMPAFAG